MRQILAAILMVLAVSFPALAVNPDEVLSDPALEARARVISKDLRCLVCQNQSIDDSDAQLARDLRVIVRERLTAGDTNEQVLDFVVARYGEFVLLRPRLALHTILLWATPVLVVLAGVVLLLRRRKAEKGLQERLLTAEEEKRLDDLLSRQ